MLQTGWNEIPLGTTNQKHHPDPGSDRRQQYDISELVPQLLFRGDTSSDVANSAVQYRRIQEKIRLAYTITINQAIPIL